LGAADGVDRRDATYTCLGGDPGRERSCGGVKDQPDKKRVELWLPTGETKVSVVDGKVTVWDEMTMEKKLLKKQPGFSEKEER
jgi:hypothetical protein